jgi:hypothetical protein
MEKDLRKEMLSQNIIKTKYFGFLTLFYLKDNAYYQQLLFIEERSKGHVLPESFYRYALACCDELMLLIERYYFSWLVVVSGAHGQLRQMRKWLLKLYFSLKAQYEKTSCNVWQLHDERQPIKSMNFVETMILNPDQATKGVCFQLWQGDNSVSGVDWWASQIFKLPQTQIADVKEFIRQQGDDLAAAVVKKIEKQLSQTITQEGLSRFYSSKWSLWVNDLHQRYQQWGYLQDSMWQNKLSQLSFLSRYAESAYQWASSHQTEGIAGEYRQAMVDLGFRMKSGGLDAN